MEAGDTHMTDNTGQCAYYTNKLANQLTLVLDHKYISYILRLKLNQLLFLFRPDES